MEAYRTDVFYFNNCKIANELRKYRDLANRVNQVSLTGQRVRRPSDAQDWAEYVITRELSYLDMVTANALYTLMEGGIGAGRFQAETVARLMAGDPKWRLAGERCRALEERLCKLAETEIYILADHDHQVEGDLYEGIFAPLTWTGEPGKRRFQFIPGGELPLYQYARDHRQLIRVPANRLQEDKERGQTRHSNSDQTLALRHYLLQELAILDYANNGLQERKLQLVQRDSEGQEKGLLWILGMEGESQNPDSEAKRLRTVQGLMLELLRNWEVAGQLGSVGYEKLEAGEGPGVRLYTLGSSGTKNAEEPEETQKSSEKE